MAFDDDNDHPVDHHHAHHHHADHHHHNVHHHHHHNHIQGVCNDEAGSAVVCGPTQIKNKKVKMMFKARLLFHHPHYDDHHQHHHRDHNQPDNDDLFIRRQTPLVRATKTQRRVSKR